MGGHIFQRAGLLILVAFFAIYTVVEYLSTRHVLAQCVELTTQGAAQSSSAPATDNEPAIILPETTMVESPTAVGGNDIVDSLAENIEPEAVSPVVGKVMMMYGNLADTDISKRLIEGHRAHAEAQGHSFHLFTREVLDGMWSKQAWLLSVLLEQMRKPEEKRTKWLHWCDADVVLMNPNVPLDIFLPPKNFEHVNLLVTNDHNGLNAGTFFIRVNEWGVRFLIDVLALRTYRPDEKLKYKEQSATSILLTDEKYKNSTMYVPQRWFNAYRGPREGQDLVRGAQVPPNTIKPGDLQLHFSGGKKNKAHISEWLEYAANETSAWVVPLKMTKLKTEVALFWKLEEERRSWDTPIVSKSKKKTSKSAATKETATKARATKETAPKETALKETTTKERNKTTLKSGAKETAKETMSASVADDGDSTLDGISQVVEVQHGLAED